jgi:hypothetical protein
MGLLDDAIREHLELKRLRGADPVLVAREKHDAFGPVHGGLHGGEVTDAEGDGYDAPEDLATDLTYEDTSPAVDEGVTPVDEHFQAPQPREADHVQTSPPDADRELSHVGQETAEIDMRLVLEEAEEAEDGAGEQVAQEPGPPEVDPDQERLWFDEDGSEA